jgi:hypothetical protein
VRAFARGEKYDGQWQDGKQHGKGKFMLENKCVYNGYWVHDKCHGKNKYTDTNENVYD